MMPTLGQYAKLLNNKDKYVVGELDVQHSGTVAINDTLVDTPEQMTVLETATKEKSASEVMEIDDQSSQDSVTQLMVMSANNRISLLRNLTNVQALSLIDEINQAMAINREQDIASVVAMIRAKDLPLEAIISRLEAV